MKPSPERATLERQGKRKAEADGKRNKTSGGGGGQKRLNQPDTAKTYNNLSTQRAKPTWREENARTHEIGTHGELVNDMIHPHCMQSVVIRLKGPRLSRPNPVNGLSCQPLNYVHKFQPHRENQKKETTPGKHVLIPPKMPCHVANSRAPYSLGHHWKTDVVAASDYAARKPREELKPHGGQLSTKRHRQGENRKMASSSLYLDELLIQKCKFRHRFTVHS